MPFVPASTHPALYPCSVMHSARSWDGEVSVPQRTASASLASSGTPFRTKAPPSSTPGPAPSGGATTQGSAIGASPLSPAKQATGGVALTATATSQAADSSSRAAASAKEKAAAAEQAKALQQQISKLEKQAAEAGAKQGGNAGTATAGARPSDFSLRERQLVARQGEVAVAPALDKTLSGVPQRGAAVAAQQAQQRRSVT